MYLLKDSVDIMILDSLDTQTLAFLTDMKDRLELSSYKEVVDLINECTNKYKLEQLLLTLVSKEGAPDG